MTDTLFEPENGTAEAHYLEMIALLQDEVSRLEAELMSRQGLDSVSPDIDAHRLPQNLEADRAAAAEQQRLTSELASREETISLLLDQLRLVEEAERATRAEWEQLAGWLAEVEDRVDRQDQSSTGDSRERIAALERQTEEARTAPAKDRGVWDRERQSLKRENERLNSLLKEKAAAGKGSSKSTTSDAALRMLESENSSLIQRCHELEADRQHQVQSLTESLEATRRELTAARAKVSSVEDDRVREKREFEVALAAVRSQSVRASLHGAANEGGGAEPSPPTESNGALEADIRIRVFRQHLREIHSQEEESQPKPPWREAVAALEPHRAGRGL